MVKTCLMGIGPSPQRDSEKSATGDSEAGSGGVRHVRYERGALLETARASRRDPVDEA